MKKYLKSNSSYVLDHQHRLKDCCEKNKTLKRKTYHSIHQQPVIDHLNNTLTVNTLKQNKPAQNQNLDSRHQLSSKQSKIQSHKELQNKLFNMLSKHNQLFFKQKAKLCCKKKPPVQRFDFGPRINQRSVYQSDYTNKKGQPNHKISLPVQTSKYIPQQKQSQYIAQYPQHPLQNKFQKQPQKVMPTYPFISTTSYASTHSGAKAMPAVQIPPKDNIDFTPNMPFTGQSIYGKDYTPKQSQMAQSFKPKHKRPMSAKIPFRTSYRDNYNKKPWNRQKKMGPIDLSFRYPKGQHDTQYTIQYPNKHGHQLRQSQQTS